MTNALTPRHCSHARTRTCGLIATLTILIAACDHRSASGSGTVATARQPAAPLPVQSVVTDTLAASARAICQEVATSWRDIARVEVRVIRDTLLDPVPLVADSDAVRACLVVAEDSTAFAKSDSVRLQRDGPAKSAYWERAEQSGWAHLIHLAADGPDGSVMAYQRGVVRCVVDQAWDGGDDADSTYVPSPWYRQTTSCWPHSKALSVHDTT